MRERSDHVPRWWLVVGSPKIWETAFAHGNLWGLKESQRGVWGLVDKHDLLLFYAAHPISGVIGVGSVQSKFIQDIPLWPDEVASNQVLWPLRLELRVLYCWPRESWKETRVATSNLIRRARNRQPFQVVEESLVQEALSTFPGEIQALSQPQAVQPLPENQHDQTIAQLLEIGRLQNYIADKEYDVGIGRLDVVWRRVVDSVPNYVFEVHIGGSLDRDLSKLKHAWDRWNSHIFLVSIPEERGRAEGLLAGAFHEIRKHLRIIEVATVAELAQRKRSVRDLEQELGIL
jgi:hypothetical protein